MIITTLSEMSEQSALSDNMRTALEFLKEHGNSPLDSGRFEIPDSPIGGFAQSYYTEEASDSLRYEAHREFIDVQYIISGSETMKWLPLDEIEVTQEYSQEGDCLLGVPQNGSQGDIPFRAGQVMILYPTDAHAPGVANGEGPLEVKKLVIKVPVE